MVSVLGFAINKRVSLTVYLLLLVSSVECAARKPDEFALARWGDLSATIPDNPLVGTFQDRLGQGSFTIRAGNGQLLIDAIPAYSSPQDNEFPAKWKVTPLDGEEYELEALMTTYQGCEWFCVRCANRDIPAMDLLRRPGDRQPIPYFIHFRAMFPLLGHKKRLVLITDTEAIAECKVYIEDLEAATLVRIDRPAIEAAGATTGCAGCFLAGGEAFSADDLQVLLQVGVHSAVRSQQQDALLRKRQTELWYSVSSKDGHIIKSFGSKKPRWD